MKCEVNGAAVDVEGKLGEGGLGKELRVGGLVAALKLAADDSPGIDYQEADVAGIVEDGIDGQESGKFHVEIGLFFHLPDRARLNCLIHLQEARGQRPEAFLRFDGSLHEQYLTILDDGDGGGNGVLVLVARNR